MLRSASAVAASFVWWFVARCPQTAVSRWNQSSSNWLVGLLLPSVSLAFPGRWKPSDGKSSRAASERARAQTHHTKRTQTHWACAKFHRAVKAIRDRWERRASGGELHAGSLEAITRCRNNTLRSLHAFFYLLPMPKFRWKESLCNSCVNEKKNCSCVTRKQIFWAWLVMHFVDCQQGSDVSVNV